MSLNVGVNVQEVDGQAVPAIAGAATSVAAFLGRTERGVPDRAVRISNLDQFRSRFGNYSTSGYLAFAVDGFFLNGGREAYVTRVAAAGTPVASATLSNRVTPNAGQALAVFAGYRGTTDPGDWGKRLRVDVADDPRGNTQPQADIPGTATVATLASVDGFQVGSVVRFVDTAATVYRKLTQVDAAARTITWAGQLNQVITAATGTVVSADFSITVRYQAATGSPWAVVERWRNLSMESDSAAYATDRINQPFTGSTYITLTDLSGNTAIGVKNPAAVSNTALNGSAAESAPGSSDMIGSAALHTGLNAFDHAQMQLLAVPDVHTLAAAGRDLVVRAAIDYCAGRGDCMYVGAAPDRGMAGSPPAHALSDYTQLESAYVQTTKQYSGHLQGSKAYGALYVPWILVGDPVGTGPAPVRFIPPDGHVMGVYARTDIERGIWKAPAGMAAQVRGALSVSATFTDEQHTDLVENGFVNGVRFQTGAGIIVAASRTLSTDTRWWFVNVRLLFNFVKSSLRDGLRFVRQEPHSEALRKTVRLNVVTPFLLGLWRRGAFGSDPPAKVFTVKCDAENNPPQEVDLGNFKIEVYFYPVRPAETVLIVVGQQPSGASATEG